MNAVHRLLNAVADVIAPLEARGGNYLATLDPAAGADRLADAEANIDAWEQVDLPTELPAEVEGSDEESEGPPPEEWMNGGNGFATTRQPVTYEVASVIAVVLRGQGINSAAIYADLVARELRHHFQIFPK